MFELNPQGLNWPRGVMVLDVVLVPLIVFWAIGKEQYLLSAVFAVLFAARLRRLDPVPASATSRICLVVAERG